jgi:hypothetical protein
MDSARYDMVVQCGAGGQPKLDLIRTHTRLWCCCYMSRWSEPDDLCLLLSQTKYNWSLAPDEDDMDSARYDMVAQCGAGGQPKLDLIRTHTKLWCCCYLSRWSEPDDLCLLLSQTKYNGSLAPDEDDMDSARYDMVAQ